MMLSDCTNSELVHMTVDHIDGARSLWSRTAGIGLSDADEPCKLKTFLELNDGLCFVILSGDRVIGTVLTGCDGRRAYIYHLAVDEDYRGHGYGKLLMEAVMDGLHSKGIGKAHLFVMKTNESAQSFYPHIGWTRRDDLVVFSQDVCDFAGGASDGACTC